MPRFYWDFAKAKKNGDKRTTPFTPAVGVLHAMQEALRLMIAEDTGWRVRVAHRRIGARSATASRSWVSKFFADPAAASNTVTAVRAPEGLDAAGAHQVAARGVGIVVGSGQDWLKGSIFRIGHMGYVDTDDIDAVLTGSVLRSMRHGWSKLGRRLQREQGTGSHGKCSIGRFTLADLSLLVADASRLQNLA